jgi:hypothetical protein
MLPNPRAAELRAAGMPVVAWTVRDALERDRLAPHVDNIIFEGFHA